MEPTTQKGSETMTTQEVQPTDTSKETITSLSSTTESLERKNRFQKNRKHNMTGVGVCAQD
jgi:hypothetical protein